MGTLVSEQRYLPFGEVRTDVGTIAQTDFGYTGQRNNAAIGWMDYNARFYSPALGAFVQPDTIVPDLANPQDWNRYSYVRNNPIKYNDPSGHIACNSADGDCSISEYTPAQLIQYSGYTSGQSGYQVTNNRPLSNAIEK